MRTSNVSLFISTVDCATLLMGTIEPAFTKTGILSRGVALVMVCPPSNFRPVQKSYHEVFVGKYTFVSETPASVIGFTRNDLPNMYSKGCWIAFASVPKSITSGRMIVDPLVVTCHASE